MAKKNTTKKKFIYGLKIFFFAILAVIIGASVGLLAGTVKSLPSIEQSAIDKPKETSKVYDVNGKLITELFEENRTFIPLSKIPVNFQDAIVAIEDDRFYQHHGVDFRGIARALWIDITGKGGLQGGSTITQQLAKNVFLTHDRTITRKVQEAFLAVQLERKYTKEEILEFYLNQIYFGHGAYGVQAAAQVYFGKNAEDLTLAECTMIAGLPKGPGYYSPYLNWEAAKNRQATVLNRMVELGYLTPEQAQEAKEQPLNLPGLKVRQKAAPYFTDYVTQYLIGKYGANSVYRGGLKIYTTLNLEMQKAAEESLARNLPAAKLDKKGIEQPQGAIIALDPNTGYIRAMVGGRDFKNSQMNRATMAHRSPGSTFKPFVYVAAIDNGYGPNSIIDDSPVEYFAGGKTWRPQNYDHRFRGPISLTQALTNSVNIATIKLAEQVGIGKVRSYAERMGIQSLTANDNNLALAIGGTHKGLTPLEMAVSYATLANGGMRVEPIAIVKVEDRDGTILEENLPRRTNALNERTASIVTGILQNVISNGTGTRANIGRPAAGKTGTTDDYRDAWFVGYTPDLVAAVWMGHDQPKPMPRISGGSIPAKMWGDFMKKALIGVPPKGFNGAAVYNEEISDPIPDISSDEVIPDETQAIDNNQDNNNLPQDKQPNTPSDNPNSNNNNNNDQGNNPSPPASDHNQDHQNPPISPVLPPAVVPN